MARLHRHDASSTRPRNISDWRIERLRDAGFDPGLAGRVASDGRYDLHALLELVDRGCPPELAARIVAPLEGDTPR